MGGMTTGVRRVRNLLSEASVRGQITADQAQRIFSRAGVVSAEEGAQEAVRYAMRQIANASRRRRRR